MRKLRTIKNPLDLFAPEGTKDCEMKCQREVLMTKDGPVIVCKGCMGVVMDNREKND